MLTFEFDFISGFHGQSQNISNFDYTVSYYPCPNQCGRKYKYKYNLNVHLRNECGVPKKFKCQICDKNFAHKTHLKSHTVIKHKIVMEF